MKKLSKSTLRWYIGTKSLMPIVEIRRRFGIDGDEVTVLRDQQGKLYVGLPEQAAHALEDLHQTGKIGYELAVDFNAAAHERLGYSREEFARMRLPDYEALPTSGAWRSPPARLRP